MGDHLICTLQLAELEGKLSFYFDILFFMAELQEVWDSAGHVSYFQLCSIIKEGWEAGLPSVGKVSSTHSGAILPEPCCFCGTGRFLRTNGASQKVCPSSSRGGCQGPCARPSSAAGAMSCFT